MRHGLVLDVALDIETPAMRAVRTLWPHLLLEPLPRLLVVREHFAQFLDADTLAMNLARCVLYHANLSCVGTIPYNPVSFSVDGRNMNILQKMQFQCVVIIFISG